MRTTRQSSKNQLTKSKKTQNRSKSENKPSPSSAQMCAVCLNELDSNHVVLNCKHKFCSVDCARGWWKFNEGCPYCRQQILFIQSKNGQRIVRDQISEQQSEDDDNFIPRCVQCWADIDEYEEKKICFTCSSNFIHKRCEMFPSKFWKCNSCLENVDDKGREVFPTIPYNPIIHYLLIQSVNKQ